MAGINQLFHWQGAHMVWRARLVFTVVLLAVAVLSTPAHADQKDPRLAQLFTQLKGAQSTESGHIVEGLIWTIWHESGKNSINIMLRQGISDMQSGRYPAALETFNAITELEPEFAEGWNKKATVLYLMGDLDGSVAGIQQTLSLEPRHFGAWSGLGLIYDALEQEEAALAAYEAALDVHPNLPTPKARVKELEQALEDRRI